MSNEWNGDGMPSAGELCICTYLDPQKVRVIAFDGYDAWLEGRHGKFVLNGGNKPECFLPLTDEGWKTAAKINIPVSPYDGLTDKEVLQFKQWQASKLKLGDRS